MTDVNADRLARTRTDLDAIEMLCAMLPAQAALGGQDGHLAAAAPIPGGDAANALGPWSYGTNSGASTAPNEATRLLRLKEHYGDDVANFHPLLTLAGWEDVWREFFKHKHHQVPWWDPKQRKWVPRDEAATVSRACAYLRAHLHEMAEAEPRETEDA